ncbi:FkbM family methyltransferase [Patescibacteria group bacterium]
MNIIDIGANFGIYSFEASSLILPNGRIFAFEPEPSTHAALKNKIIKLGISNITLYSKALSNKKGSQKLYFDKLNIGGHSLSEINPYKSSSYHEIKTTTLDDVFSNIKINLIKIDTQGAEGLVMAGGLELLKRDKPPIFLEFWPHGMDEFKIKSSDLLDIFKDIGYKILVIDKIKRITYEVNRETLYELCDSERNSNDFVDVLLKVT